MDWLLLNQHCVSSDSENYKTSVLEEVVSSEALLVQVLVSGTVSPETSILLGHGLEWNNLDYVGEPV